MTNRMKDGRQTQCTRCKESPVDQMSIVLTPRRTASARTLIEVGLDRKEVARLLGVEPRYLSVILGEGWEHRCGDPEQYRNIFLDCSLFVLYTEELL